MNTSDSKDHKSQSPYGDPQRIYDVPLAVDLGGSLCLGVLLTMWPEETAHVSGVSAPWMVVALGGAVLVFAAATILHAAAPARRVATARFLVGANAVWSVGGLVIVALAPIGLNGWGQLGVGATVVFTTVLGWWEYHLLRKTG